MYTLLDSNLTTMGTSNGTVPTTAISNWTTIEPPLSTTEAQDCNNIPMVWGFITAAIAVVFYGTNFAPVKKFDTGDGMFFQWVMCVAVWIVCLVVHLIRKSPKFYPIVMLGGLLWETGNICVVPIVKCIGLGLGLCIWGLINLLSGWATGRFGLFGLTADPPDNKLLNDFGVILAVSSAFVFAMVKSEVSAANVDHTITVEVNERSPLIETPQTRNGGGILHGNEQRDIIVFPNDRKKKKASINKVPSEEEEDDGQSFTDKLSPRSKVIVGFVLCALSGVCYGQMFTPAFYVQDNLDKYPGASQDALDYVFATGCGILLSSTGYFIIYAIFRRNKPKVYPRAILPGMLSGTMWAIGTSCWFVANKVLSEAIAFPIVTTGPAIIASLLGVFVFGEIKGKRNILILCCGIAITLTGVILTALSKKASKKSC